MLMQIRIGYTNVIEVKWCNFAGSWFKLNLGDSSLSNPYSRAIEIAISILLCNFRHLEHPEQ